MKVSLSQRHFLDACARGHGATGNTNRTGAALEKLGLVHFEYERRGSYLGRWKLTPAGEKWRSENLLSNGRLAS